MDTRGFLLKVLPWDIGGYANVHWLLERPGEKPTLPGRSCQSVDEMFTVASRCGLQNLDTYFCLSRQSVLHKRRREFALGTKALWVDLDVDKTGKDPKKYRTVEDAIAALLRFCIRLGIDKPSAIIFSGGGAHAYWFSHTTLTVDAWQPIADTFKTLAREHELKIDFVCTGDVTRVLRFPGNLNHKYDPPTRVVFVQDYCEGKEYDLQKIFSKFTKSSSQFKVAPEFQGLDPKKSLGAGVQIQELPPLPFEPIKEGCGWFREAYETGGKDFDQPQWNLMLLCATWMEDGHELAHQLGNQHPKYTPADTEKKWEHKIRERRNPKLGWPSCSTISLAGSKHCKGCPHFPEGKSPLNLGVAAAKTDAIEEAIERLGGICPPELKLPEKFAVFKDSKELCGYVPGHILKGKFIPERLHHLLTTSIRKPNLQIRNGKFGLGFTADTDRGGEQEVFIPSGNIFAPKLFDHLAENFVMYVDTPEAKKLMGTFAPSWLDRLKKEETAIRDVGTYGWRYDKEGKRCGFVYGSILYYDNGAETQLNTDGDDEFHKWYLPLGRKEAWLEACRLLTDRKRPELDIIICIGFAAPLMTFTGSLYGGIFSIWGEPGTSKSTGQMLAAAVWGHPKQTRESLTSTAKSVQRRLGRTRNLAAYWDDIQDERHQDNLFQTLFVATEGAEGGRLNRDSTMKERLEWQTMLAACSNASFIEYLTRKQRSTTAGMRRVFELEYNRNPNEPGMIDEHDANKIFGELERNYGMIGKEYAKILATEHKQIESMVDETIKTFKNAVKGTVDEAYWWGMCGVLLVGAKMARRLGADINVPAMETCLLEQYALNRQIRAGEGTEGGTRTNTVVNLTAFLNTYINSKNTIFTDHTVVNAHSEIEVLSDTKFLKQIVVQVVRDERKIIISRNVLREHLQKQGVQVRQVLNGLVKFYHAKLAKRTLGSGTKWSQTQEHCIEITVPAGDVVLEPFLIAYGVPK